MVRIHGSTREQTPSFGFLTVVEDGGNALFGGYLILNNLGRPLEFHCTAPIVPNRAQEILYGSTLRPFLFGEQIGKTLVERAKTKVELLCVDREECFSVREFTPAPVVLVLDPEGTGGDRLAPGGERPVHSAGGNQLVFSPEDAPNGAHFLAELSGLLDNLDLLEPFARIREAIEEARRGGTAA